MKICILTPRFPFPENGGDVLRINNICRYLKSKEHAVVLITFFDKANEEKYKAFANELYNKVYYIKRRNIISYFFSIFALLFNKPIQSGYYFSFAYLFTLKKVIRLERPDLYISHLLRMVPYLKIFNLQNESIVEMTDVLSKTYTLVDKSSKFSLKKWIYKIEKMRIAKYEIRTISTFKKCVLVSDADKNLLGDYKSLSVYPNGVNCLGQFHSRYKKGKIVFVGNMRTLQNQDAVRYFVYEILPLIKKMVPQAVLHIIGDEPPMDIQRMSDRNSIVVSGYVHSVEDEIKDAAVSIAPIRVAAGIQNKILISMACGIPVVLTSLVSAGIPGLVSNKNCIIADGKSDFAHAVISLIQNGDMRDIIGKAGYDMVWSGYSWNKVLEGYEYC